MEPRWARLRLIHDGDDFVAVRVALEGHRAEIEARGLPYWEWYDEYGRLRRGAGDFERVFNALEGWHACVLMRPEEVLYLDHDRPGNSFANVLAILRELDEV